jgi:glucosamine kinase
VTFVVGIDGGGTRTRAVIVDASGIELGRGESAGAVATAGEPEKAAGAVVAAIAAALADMSAAGSDTVARSDTAAIFDPKTGFPAVDLPAAVLFAGLAGGGVKAAREGVASALEELGVARSVRVGTDVEAAFADAFPEGPGILLIAGTGSIAWGRDVDGGLHRVGGWGQQLGDEGSGYALGMNALRLVTRAHDGRAGPTRLTEVLLVATGCALVDELVPWSADASKSGVAALAPLVVEAADGGDEAAGLIVEAAVDDLVAHVSVLRATVGPEVEIVLWGGLLADGGPLGARALSALEREGCAVSSRTVDPPMGAARIARSILP